jgi:DNA-3-methyladenine glycosylase I
VNPTRCDWSLASDRYIDYHDKEWGVPVKDDRVLFEFILLEGAQAGLSWQTILDRRPGYREVFHDYEVEKVAAMSSDEIAAALQNPGIIRNRQKVHSAVNNARAFIAVAEKYGSFAQYIWQFTDGKPIQNEYHQMADIPAVTPLAETISKDMKKRGFSFFGPTICYAHMQATGMVNDHIVSCFRYGQIRALGETFSL